MAKKNIDSDLYINKFKCIEKSKSLFDFLPFNKKTNVIFQNEDVDCGPACLANICQLNGFYVSVTKISKIINLGSTGASFYDLNFGAKKIGFDTLPCKLETSELKNIKHLL